MYFRAKPRRRGSIRGCLLSSCMAIVRGSEVERGIRHTTVISAKMLRQQAGYDGDSAVRQGLSCGDPRLIVKMVVFGVCWCVLE